MPAVPFLVKSAQAGSVAFWRLYKTGLLDNEYDQIVPLATGMLGAGGLHLSAPLKSMDDLGGLKLIVAGQMQSKTIAALGGAPVSIPLTDEYQAVQRKTVDRVIIGWGGCTCFQAAAGRALSRRYLGRHLDQHGVHVEEEIPVAAGCGAEDPARHLGRGAQPAIRHRGRSGSGGHSRRGDGGAGTENLTVPPEAFAKWQAKTEPVVAAWADSRKNGKEVLEKYRTLYAQAAAELAH